MKYIVLYNKDNGNVYYSTPTLSGVEELTIGCFDVEEGKNINSVDVSKREHTPVTHANERR